MYSLLLILTVQLRFQVIPHEIGVDSFGVHVLVNSLSEFGYAKWILNPLSFFGLYPLSYTSSVPFLISGFSQTAGIDMETTIFLYCIIASIIGILTVYLFANAIFPEDDLFKFFTSFAFSFSPAILYYSTWTIPTRALFVLVVSLLFYLLLNLFKSIKFAFLTFIYSIFLFATHHIFYFTIPSFFVIFVIYLIPKLNKQKLGDKKLEKMMPLVFIIGFIFMFSIPFFTGKFIETSRYAPIYINYARYLGILLPFGLGGLIYIIFKRRKKSAELFLLLTTICITPLIYEQTYLKWYLPVLFSPLIGIGLINLAKSALKKKIFIISLVLISNIIFAGYYQFLHQYDASVYYASSDERYIEDSTYLTGLWMKNNIQTSAISNDELLSMRILATTEKIHLPTSSSTNNFIYGYSTVNLSNFKYYSPFSEEFFRDTGSGIGSSGEDSWYGFNQIHLNPLDFGINYFVENVRSNGYLVWNHQPLSSKLLRKAYDKGDKVYDIGTLEIWKLNK
jgi:hypothetical protein